MCASLCPTYWTTFGITEKNRNGSCMSYARMRPPLIFWVFNSPSPRPPRADGPHRGREHVGRHCPYANNIWCGSVHALLRYRSKTAKLQKFPIDSHSNENFICVFLRPPGAANPQTTSFPFLMFALPWAKISRRSHHPALRYPQRYKQKKQTKANLISHQTLRYGEIKSHTNQSKLFKDVTGQTVASLFVPACSVVTVTVEVRWWGRHLL